MKEELVQKKSIRERLTTKKMVLVIFTVGIISLVGFVAVLKDSENPQFCTLCHNMQPYYDSWHDSNLLANKHAKANVNCHDCHEPSLAQQTEEGIKYITGDFETPLKKREFAKDFCLKCHDFEQVKAKTIFDNRYNPHDSHNGEQECISCHSMHQQSKVMCSECHSSPWMQKLPDEWKKGK
jgi:nitrate/TMAO reductase-like tetraheme cytochrome c subunit